MKSKVGESFVISLSFLKIPENADKTTDSENSQIENCKNDGEKQKQATN